MSETHRHRSSDSSVSWDRLVKLVFRNSGRSREPWELGQILEYLKVHHPCAKSSSLVSGEQGTKQDRPPQNHPNGTSLAFKKQQVTPAVAMATTVQRLLRALREEKGGGEGTW